MATVTMKKPKMITRRKPPIFGIHLPIRSDNIAAVIATQMNASPNRYSGSPLSGLLKKNALAAARAVTASVPPTQTGLEIQYKTELIAAGSRPNASLVQT
jgi:hypothetical protein